MQLLVAKENVPVGRRRTLFAIYLNKNKQGRQMKNEAMSENSKVT